MLPAQRCRMGEQRRGYDLAGGAQVRHGIGDVGRIPIDDGGDHQVQPRGSELLRLHAAVGDAALLEGADDLGKEVALFALVQPGVAAPAQFRAFGAIAHFERRLIAERTKDGIAAARARGKRPGRQPLDADKIAAAIKLVKAGLSPTAAARQLGLGRSTVYREVNRAGVERLPPPA